MEILFCEKDKGHRVTFPIIDIHPIIDTYNYKQKFLKEEIIEQNTVNVAKSLISKQF